MIHYHGTPIWPIEAAECVLRARHAFVSFRRPDQIGLVADVTQSFALDNGAFSAWKAEEPITDWSDYLEWCREWSCHPRFDWCVIPDVIEGSEAENNELLAWWVARSGRMASVPVWHLHESLGRLTQLSRVWPLVALGSSGVYAGGYASDGWKDRMAEAMGAVCDRIEDGRPRCQLHGLRMLDPRIFSAVPLRSADSTNVANNIGKDVRWTGSYQPPTPTERALVLAARIELHVTAARWMRTWEPPFALEING